MSSATPLIATNAGGVPELIDHGIDGYLVAPSDPHLLSEAIKMIALKPELAKALAKAGRRKVEKFFRSEVSAVELSDLLSRYVNLKADQGDSKASEHSNRASIVE